MWPLYELYTGVSQVQSCEYPLGCDGPVPPVSCEDTEGGQRLVGTTGGSTMGGTEEGGSCCEDTSKLANALCVHTWVAQDSSLYMMCSCIYVVWFFHAVTWVLYTSYVLPDCTSCFVIIYVVVRRFLARRKYQKIFQRRITAVVKLQLG